MKRIVITTFFIILFSFSLENINANRGIGDELSPNNVLAMIIEKRIAYPDVVYAQSQIESGWFKSSLTKNNNNLFGMRHPRKRNTTSIKSHNGYSFYSHWKKSVIDYKLWQNGMIHKINNEEEYLAYLAKNYAEDPTYVKSIKKLIKRNKNGCTNLSE